MLVHILLYAETVEYDDAWFARSSPGSAGELQGLQSWTVSIYGQGMCPVSIWACIVQPSKRWFWTERAERPPGVGSPLYAPSNVYDPDRNQTWLCWPTVYIHTYTWNLLWQNRHGIHQ